MLAFCVPCIICSEFVFMAFERILCMCGEFGGDFFVTFNIPNSNPKSHRTLGHWTATYGHCPITLPYHWEYTHTHKKWNSFNFIFETKKSKLHSHHLRLVRSLFVDAFLLFIQSHSMCDFYNVGSPFMSIEPCAFWNQWIEMVKFSTQRKMAYYDVYKLNGTWKFTKVL